MAKVLLLLGFAFLGVGLTRDVSPHNRTIILALAFISLSLTSHYFSGSLLRDIDPPYGRFVDWPNMLAGSSMLVVTACLTVWLFLTPPTKTSAVAIYPPQTSATKSEKPSITEPSSRSSVSQKAEVKGNVSGNHNTQGAVVQNGDKNIAQMGNNNQATINPDVDPNKPVVTYDFRGTKRTVTPQGISAELGREWDTSTQMKSKSESQDWKGLASIAEDAKTRAPEWLTPYYAAGEAYANLCEKEKALHDLQYFVQKAKGVPTFEGAVSSAERNLGEFKAGKWPPNAGEKREPQDLIPGCVQAREVQLFN